MSKTATTRPILRTILGIVGKFLFFLLETVILLALALYCAMFLLAKGPSPTARDIFVMSVRETSAVGFLANLFFTEEEIAQITAGNQEVLFEETDTSLIVTPDPTAPTQEGGPQPDAWGYVDEDGDGIIIEKVNGETYSGLMMIVKNPSRVVMGCKPEQFGYRGYTVAQMVEEFGAVAGINAGGFYDPDGQGNGSIPDTMVVSDGKAYYAEKGVNFGFVGFDSNHIMHVGYLSAADVAAKGIQSGVSFGPILVSNGEPQSQIFSGINPRTGIGQRSDGAVLMLVIDGRQVSSMGATFQDMVDVFLSFGAVNACNLDGGSSSVMWFGGEYINSCASVIGIRPVPTTFLVMPQEDSAHD